MRDGRHDIVGAERGDQQDRADDGVHDEVAHLERREQVFVGLLPRDRLVAGLRLDAACNLARLHDVGYADADRVDEARLPGEDLGGLHQRVGLRLVDLRDAGVGEGDDGGGQRAPLTRCERDRVADPDADFLGQPVAEDDRVRGLVEIVEAAAPDLVRQLRDPALPARVDAGEVRRRIAPRVADHRARLHRWRDGPPEPALERGDDRVGVLDAGPRHRRAEPGEGDGVVDVLDRLAGRVALLVAQRDVRHAVDELGDEVALRAVHQRRHHNREADAHRDAEHADQRLAHARQDVGHGDIEHQPHEVTRSWPAAPGPARRPGGPAHRARRRARLPRRLS